MRLDKYLCDMKYGTRSQIKKEIKDGLVKVNGEIIRKNDFRIDEVQDIVCYKNKPCVYEKYVYYMLNKPVGVVSATEDKKEKTVLSFLEKEAAKDLFPVGRLDKDTEGLLFITNDGSLAHRLLSPAFHVEKTYECLLAKPVTKEQAEALSRGVEIGEKRPTRPAAVTVLEPSKILLTITEGKFHQVKRMLKAVGNEVVHLKRIRMGALSLPPDLGPGEYRRLTKEELEMLKSETVEKEIAMSDISRQETVQAEKAAKADWLLTGTDAVIFDLDGSLVDSMWMWHAIDTEYLGRFGLEVPENLQALIGGRSFSETAVYFKELFGIPDDLEQIKKDWNQMAWDKYAYEVPLKEGAAEFISLCMERKIKLGIATSNSRELVENVVAVHGLRDHFDCIVTGCEVAKGKPAPDVYLAAAKMLAVLPERCLVFEDIVHGIMAGKAAGMKVCAVYDKASEWQDEEKRKLADHYIHDFRELTGKAWL